MNFSFASHKLRRLHGILMFDSSTALEVNIFISGAEMWCKTGFMVCLVDRHICCDYLENTAFEDG